MSFTGFGQMDDMFGRMDRMMASMMTNMNDMLVRDPFGAPFPLMPAFNPAMDPMSRLMSHSNALFPTSSIRMDRMMASMMTNMNDMLVRDPFGAPFPLMPAFNPAMDPMSRLMSHSNALFPTSSMSFSHHMSPSYSTSYSTSSSVYSMSTDMSGRPQIYESSHSSRSGPGGVRETTSSVRDSRSGLQKMSIGRHIEDRAHVMERTRNQYTGEEEANNEYINIEEEEAPQFNNEFRQRMGAYGQHYRRPQIAAPPTHRPQLLALPAPNARQESPETSSHSHRQEKSYRNHKMSHKKHSDKKTKKPYKKS
ncbi:unnamed protein product [Medioppia subpectinata]|uniref:Myeloid leukemia factor n=1 Tax=Medioppia subpectinata TaxID=1979941 RepID=A0A7R9LEN7_9ACAR|nr:unnamed protein product [Medioppia subpectinata]CAG2118100.1 unnamed protein product [Medioppia subpectinata]